MCGRLFYKKNKCLNLTQSKTNSRIIKLYRRLEIISAKIILIQRWIGFLKFTNNME
jgi:hypothetical protein